MAQNQYLVNSTDMTTVADAIRTKGGTSAPLAFPDGFANAVSAIQSGGGGADLANVDVYIADFTSSDELSVSIGAVDKYSRQVVS